MANKRFLTRKKGSRNQRGKKFPVQRFVAKPTIFTRISKDTGKNEIPPLMAFSETRSISVDDKERIKRNLTEKRLERDVKTLNKNLLNPTDPVSREKWAKNPGRYDLVDYDTPNRNDDVITLYRGIRGSNSDMLLSEFVYNKTNYNTLGNCWTGNEHVARLYGIRGVTDIGNSNHLVAYDTAIQSIIDENNTIYKKPYHGLIFRFNARGEYVTGYNPSMFPYEYEARIQIPKSVNEKTFSHMYPNLEVGFIKGDEGRRVEWHKVRKGVLNKTLKEISEMKPKSVEDMMPVKKTTHGYIMENHGVLEPAKKEK